MNMLVNEIIEQINKSLKNGTVNLVTLEDFDSPVIYANVCKSLNNLNGVKVIARVDNSKYQTFLAQQKNEWENSLDFLKNNGYVDEQNPLTMYRNESVNETSTLLLILMGAEAAGDNSSLKDFKRISIDDVIAKVKKDYSKWFESFLFNLDDGERDECRYIIRNIFTSVFMNINIDLIQLSNFVDYITAKSISDIDVFLEEVFGTLNTWWSIPRIEKVPALSVLKKPRKLVDIIVAAYDFINKPVSSASKIKQYSNKIDEYANKNQITLTSPFNTFNSYSEFKTDVIAMLKGERVAELRPKFLDADFGIIYEILNIKATERKKGSDKVIKLVGEPLEVYFRMITDACKRYCDKADTKDLPNDVFIEVSGIKLSNCLSKDDDNQDSANSIESQYHDICTFMGGMLNFINEGFNGNSVFTSLNYLNEIDPFDFDNYMTFCNRIKTNNKWGENCQISFVVHTSSDSENKEYKSEYKWSFSPFASWKNAFSLINALQDSDSDESSIPLLIACKNINDFIACESEGEFYAKVESMQNESLSRVFDSEIKKTYSSTDAYNKLNLVCEKLGEWYDKIRKNGLFSCMDNMNTILGEYSEILESLTNSYNDLSVNAKNNIGYFLELFTIVGNKNFIKDAYSNEVIVPAYHPAMLEKISTQSYYYVFSFVELMDKLNRKIDLDCNKEITSICELGAVIQGVDVIPTVGNTLLTCQSVWGYYAVYCPENCNSDYAGMAEMVDDEVDIDDELSDEGTPQIRVIKRNIMDYIHTFPARMDGLNVSFIAPAEIQYVVKGIESVAKEIEKRLKDQDIVSTLNVKIICFNGSKNVNSYLRYWLDNYLAQERCVRINVSLKYVSESNSQKEVANILKNQDICFIYNILDDDGVDFNSYYLNEQDENELMTSYPFPMTFIPDTVPSTHSTKRKVNISQVQFNVSNKYTQFAHKVVRPDNVEGQYKAMQLLSLRPSKEDVLNIAHDNCRWVVCEDRAIDRDLLQNRSAKIIGFTTGEGCFGEYNVTISAKEDVLTDIKALLKIRLQKVFNNWGQDRAEKAANYCIQLTKNFDGSRLLKALNQRDYEIHNFLAYALTVQSLKIGNENAGEYVARSLLNMDSYQHWFTDNENRPDFLLLEILNDDSVADKNTPIKLRAKVIECKMGTNVDTFVEKAHTQVEVGVSSLMEHWNPKSTSVNRRYWFTQLYRALAFSKLLIKDGGDVDYNAINSKIFGILNGNFDIEWSGVIYAYGINENTSDLETSSMESENLPNGITLYRAGQIYIQKMILPDEMQNEDFVYSEIQEHSAYEQYNEETDTFDEDVEAESSETEANPVQTNEEKELVTAGGGVTAPSAEPASISDNSYEEDDNPSADQSVGDIVENVEENSENQEETAPQTKPKKPLSEVRVLLGKDNSGKEYYWEYGNKQLNNRHLLINGNSGYGKTYCIQGLLMDLSRQGVPAIVFDYTGGFAKSKLENIFTETLGDKIVQRVVKTKKIPINPFLRGNIVIDEDLSFPEENNDVANRIKAALNNVYQFGDQQQAVIYQAVLDGMKTYGESMSFVHLRDILADMDNKYADSVVNKITPFIDMEPFVTGENFNWDDIRSSDGMVFIFQMAGYQREDQLLLTELLLRDLWSFAQNRGDKNKPFVVVLDEAQNLRHNAESPSGKILTEGRKFGVSGWYATQFMGGQLDKDEIQCLQQAAQKLYFCPPDNGVMDTAKSIDISSQGSKDWAERLKKLKLGECITCGSMLVNNTFTKYTPRQIKVASLEERIKNG